MIKVLDKGFVRLVDSMGDDNSVVQAARVSYGNGTKTPDEDKRLINYLLTNKHTSPFEQVKFKFHVKCPVFVARQWFRHRTWSYNEISQRYSVIKDEFYYPEKWRMQDTKNKQGSLAPAINITAHMKLVGACEDAYNIYTRMVDEGIAKEMARMILPTNIYTEFYGSVDAHNLMAFFRLRSESHAQWEIRQYSNALWPLFRAKMPWTAEAFLNTIDGHKYTCDEGIVGLNLIKRLEEYVSKD